MKVKLLYVRLLLGIITLFITNEVTAACTGITANFTASTTFYCGTGPYTVNFTNTTTGSSGTTSFEWWENGVLIGTTPTVAVGQSSTITAIGSYDFMLIAIDTGEPCRDTLNVLVTIAPIPVASYTFSPNNGCALTDVDFTNTSTGLYAGSTFLWNFGDATTSTLQDPTHVYAIGGSYNVSLTVTNGAGCTSTVAQTVTVIDAPITAIAGDDGDGDLVYCLPPGDNTLTETVTFSNTTTGATTYDWDFGDGSPIFSTGSLADFTHVYSTYGTFTVVMTATHANGCTANDTLIVIFEKFVSAGLTLDITEYSGCAPHPVSTLTNLSVNATTYVWDFGDGTIITTTSPNPPAYSYTTAGNYTITLTASNSCNTATATISPIIIIDSPTAGFTPSVTNGCAPQTISFVNTSVGTQPANNYQWNMGNGNTYVTTITPPNQVYPNQGTYTIELIAANACGADTITQTVFIDTIPTVDLILDPISGCTPLNVDPTATLLTGTNVNWQWFIDGVFTYTTPLDIPNQNFISLNPNDSTLHTIQVNVSNGCGSNFELDSVYVHPPVIAIL